MIGSLLPSRARRLETLHDDLDMEGHRGVIHVSISVVTEDSRIEISEDNEHAGLVTIDAREQAVLALLAATAKVLRYYGRTQPLTAAECAAAAERLENPPPIDPVSVQSAPMDPVHPEATP